MPRWLSTISAHAARQSDSRCCRLCQKFDKSTGAFSDSFDVFVGQWGHFPALCVDIQGAHNAEHAEPWQSYLNCKLPDWVCQGDEYAIGSAIKETDLGA